MNAEVHASDASFAAQMLIDFQRFSTLDAEFRGCVTAEPDAAAFFKEAPPETGEVDDTGTAGAVGVAVGAELTGAAGIAGEEGAGVTTGDRWTGAGAEGIKPAALEISSRPIVMPVTGS